MMDSYNSEIYFSGTGGVATLNGGIADLNGYEALLGGPAIDNVTSNVYVDGNVTVNFGAESVNKNFFGNFNQSAGVTNVYADNWIAGANNVSGGRLNIFQTMTVGDVNLTTGGAIGIGDGVSAQVLTTPNFMGDGTGNVWLNTNGTWSDMLKITGTAAGGGILNFNVIGNSPTSQKIEVVDMTGATDNGAIFTLAGGTLDIGAWAYDLVHEADGNWYLESEGTLSTTAQSVMGIPGLHLSVVKTGMNELRKRLGHLRNNNNDEQLTGPWIRAYGEHLKVHELVNAKMDVAGLEGGIDFMANMWNGKVYFGVMGGMLDSENIRFKTSVGGAGGWTRTPSVGAYATWVHKSGSSNKWFVDLTARHFWAHTYVEKDDKTNGYDVTRNFWAFSGETGKLYYMESPEWMNIGSLQHSHLSIEPKVEVRYKSGAAMDFETFAGDQGHVDTTESFTTHLNVQLNFLPNGTLSTWRPWIELGVYNEWLGDTEMEFAGEKLCSSDTRGMGMRAAIGTSAELSERTYIYGGYTFEDGEIYTSHLLNIGIRTKF
jgi:outer membrane autotransporter protein